MNEAQGASLVDVMLSASNRRPYALSLPGVLRCTIPYHTILTVQQMLVAHGRQHCSWEGDVFDERFDRPFGTLWRVRSLSV